MHFVSEDRLDDGVVERRFTIDEIPGVLWTPGSASAPVPLILLGHPGGLDAMYPRLVARARRATADGFAAATVELPGSGDRPACPTSSRRAPTCAGRWRRESRSTRSLSGWSPHWSRGPFRSGGPPWTRCSRCRRSAAPSGTRGE